ncbi:protein ALP1-like [Papaver somniferum]|uniref:protein ALP1-like n=1 Tax=Papaver somniferum TaxID=3469 RepID=UPI000E6F74CE|nr:protein ALP1-like [Papaver somniferum]
MDQRACEKCKGLRTCREPNRIATVEEYESWWSQVSVGPYFARVKPTLVRGRNRDDISSSSQAQFRVPYPPPMQTSSYGYENERSQNENENVDLEYLRSRVVILENENVGLQSIMSDTDSDEDYFSRRRKRRRANAAMVVRTLMWQQSIALLRELFLKIKDDLCEMDPEWPLGIDALGIPGHYPHMKTLACLRLLATGQSSDSIDDYVRMGKTTLYKYLKRFVRNIVRRYGGEYLRNPNQDDINRILAENEARGFPGMVGSVDCMHCPGSNNDLNVLNTSPLFDGIFDENAPKVDFQVGGGRFDMGYYLADGIYPKLSIIVQAYKKPTNSRQRCFTKMQEGARKDVERAFGILQAKWHIVRGPVEYWDEEDLKFIMLSCVILHNMIIEHERQDGA